MTKTVTILAVTGAQQAAAAARFAAAGWHVRGTSRRPSETAHGPTLVADLETGDGLASALDGADAAVLTLPQDHRPGVVERVARTVADAAGRAGVGRLVVNIGATIDAQATGELFTDMRAARAAAQSSGAPTVVLQPTVFMDNLLAPWSLPAIVNEGVLASPAPANAPISWLSHRTLADFIFAAATHPDAAGGDFRIGGPDALSCEDLAAALANRLGKPVRFHRVPLVDFAAGLDQAFGPPAGQRIASLYALLDDRPDAMAVKGDSAKRLGVTPESFAAFAARQSW